MSKKNFLYCSPKVALWAFFILMVVTAVLAGAFSITDEANACHAGCIDPEAINYDAGATDDDGSCIYPPEEVFGCTDFEATNYNPEATQDDESCVYPPEEPTDVTIVATKIVCEEEVDLPNWGGGGSDITAVTANNWVLTHESCSLTAGWQFEWAPAGTSNPGDNNGVVGGSWTVFGPTNGSGVAQAVIEGFDFDTNDRIWVREVSQNGYLEFSGSGSSNNVSAEMYCHEDVLKYDNYDYILNPESDNTYYCAAWNVIVAEPVLGCTDSEATNYNPEVTQDDGSCVYPPEEPVLGCTDPEAINYNPDATQDDESCVYIGDPLPVCSDGIDNDEDGGTDSADAGCHTDGDSDNPESYDPNDEDENFKPVIIVLGDNPLIITQYNSFTDPNTTADDKEDGDITEDVVVGGDTVDTATQGGYVITYDVTDSDGLAADQRSRTVIVRPGACTNCGGGGSSPVCSDSIDNDLDTFTDHEDPACHTDGDPNNPDSYDPERESENSKPVITVLGDNPITLNAGVSFTDSGATADDEEDGDITGDIFVGGATVDTATSGAYVITYNVTDSKGLVADEKTRVVNVGSGTVEKPCDYLLEYLKLGENNNPVEVAKLQSFLILYEGFDDLQITEFFDIATFDAVSAFQEKYGIDVLSPWAHEEPTGYVYITTKKKINEIYCEREFPLTIAQQDEIDGFRGLLLSLREIFTEEEIEETFGEILEGIGQAETSGSEVAEGGEGATLAEGTTLVLEEGELETGEVALATVASVGPEPFLAALNFAANNDLALTWGFLGILLVISLLALWPKRFISWSPRFPRERNLFVILIGLILVVGLTAFLVRVSLRNGELEPSIGFNDPFFEFQTPTSASLKDAVNTMSASLTFLKGPVSEEMGGNLIKFGEIGKVLAPTVFTDEVIGYFEPDATFFVFVDEDGMWLSIIAKVSEGVDLESVRAKITQIENNLTGVGNLYLEEPGSASSWRNGEGGGVVTRYVVFEKEGAAFNYGWKDNTFIMATSYSAFNEIVKQL